MLDDGSQYPNSGDPGYQGGGFGDSGFTGGTGPAPGGTDSGSMGGYQGGGYGDSGFAGGGSPPSDGGVPGGSPSDGSMGGYQGGGYGDSGFTGDSQSGIGGMDQGAGVGAGVGAGANGLGALGVGPSTGGLGNGLGTPQAGLSSGPFAGFNAMGVPLGNSYQGMGFASPSYSMGILGSAMSDMLTNNPDLAAKINVGSITGSLAMPTPMAPAAQSQIMSHISDMGTVKAGYDLAQRYGWGTGAGIQIASQMARVAAGETIPGAPSTTPEQMAAITGTIMNRLDGMAYRGIPVTPQTAMQMMQQGYDAMGQSPRTAGLQTTAYAQAAPGNPSYDMAVNALGVRLDPTQEQINLPSSVDLSTNYYNPQISSPNWGGPNWGTDLGPHRFGNAAPWGSPADIAKARSYMDGQPQGPTSVPNAPGATGSLSGGPVLAAASVGPGLIGMAQGMVQGSPGTSAQAKVQPGQDLAQNNLGAIGPQLVSGNPAMGVGLGGYAPPASQGTVAQNDLGVGGSTTITQNDLGAIGAPAVIGADSSVGVGPGGYAPMVGSPGMRGTASVGVGLPAYGGGMAQGNYSPADYSGGPGAYGQLAGGQPMGYELSSYGDAVLGGNTIAENNLGAPSVQVASAGPMPSPISMPEQSLSPTWNKTDALTEMGGTTVPKNNLGWPGGVYPGLNPTPTPAVDLTEKAYEEQMAQPPRNPDYGGLGQKPSIQTGGHGFAQGPMGNTNDQVAGHTAEALAQAMGNGGQREQPVLPKPPPTPEPKDQDTKGKGQGQSLETLLAQLLGLGDLGPLGQLLLGNGKLNGGFSLAQLEQAFFPGARSQGKNRGNKLGIEVA